MISREVNFRPGDITSIKNFYKPTLYKKRLTKPEGDIVLKKIKLLNPILPFITHDIMMNYDIFQKLNIKVKLKSTETHLNLLILGLREILPII